MKGYKLLTIVFCIIITIVIVIFCNDENIDTTKKVNDQKLANLFAIIFSSVGTFAAILFSQKQIDFAAASIKPDIFPNTVSFVIRESSNPIGFVESTDNPEFIFPTKNTDKKSRIALELINKGVGTAKNIKIKWLFDNIEVRNIVEERYSIPPIPEKLKDDYIVSGASGKFDLPRQYLPCCGPKVEMEKGNGKFMSTMQSESEYVTNILPPLTLTIEFDNIQDESSSKSYQTNILVHKNMVIFNFS